MKKHWNIAQAIGFLAYIYINAGGLRRYGIMIGAVEHGTSFVDMLPMSIFYTLPLIILWLFHYKYVVKKENLLCITISAFITMSMISLLNFLPFNHSIADVLSQMASSKTESIFLLIVTVAFTAASFFYYRHKFEKPSKDGD